MTSHFNIVTPTAVHFGCGVSTTLTSVLAADVEVVVLVRGASESTSKSIRQKLKVYGCTLHEVTVSAEPTVASINAAFDTLPKTKNLAIVACGGGSVLDTAKALRFCLERGEALPEDYTSIDAAILDTEAAIPLIAVPTTAGTGAEVTSNAVLGTDTSKVSLRGRGLFPSVALVDPELLKSAPKSVTLGAGLDAVTQTIEAYTSRLSSPYTVAITEPNVRIGPQVLRNIVERGDQEAWTQMAWISLSSGLALSNGGLGAAHGLAAVLGAGLNAPHGLLCGRLLRPVLLQNRAAAEIGTDTFRKIENSIEALAAVFPARRGSDDLSGFEAWLDDNSVPRLREYSADKARFNDFAETSVFASSSTKNAVPLAKADFAQILDAAY